MLNIVINWCHQWNCRFLSHFVEINMFENISGGGTYLHRSIRVRHCDSERIHEKWHPTYRAGIACNKRIFYRIKFASSMEFLHRFDVTANDDGFDSTLILFSMRIMWNCCFSLAKCLMSMAIDLFVMFFFVPHQHLRYKCLGLPDKRTPPSDWP